MLGGLSYDVGSGQSTPIGNSSKPGSKPLEPDQQFVVTKVAYLSAAFAGTAAKGGVVGQPTVRTLDQQRRISLGCSVHLEGYLTTVVEIGKCGGE
jgi:hypothetical protein